MVLGLVSGWFSPDMSPGSPGFFYERNDNILLPVLRLVGDVPTVTEDRKAGEGCELDHPDKHLS